MLLVIVDTIQNKTQERVKYPYKYNIDKISEESNLIHSKTQDLCQNPQGLCA